MTDDIIEGEVTEVPSRAVAVVPPTAVQTSLITGGTAGLALMSDEAFEANLAGLVKIRERVDRVKLAIMRPEVDYGVIPGTKKPTLLKPGAETLLRTFGLADSYVIQRILGDGELTADDWVVDEHRLRDGTPVLPGAAHLELMIAALRAAGSRS